MQDSASGREALQGLVEHFGRSLPALKSSSYNEAQVRQEFINPFFSLLGWDVDNKQGYAEAYKDVIHEDAIKVGGYRSDEAFVARPYFLIFSDSRA